MSPEEDSFQYLICMAEVRTCLHVLPNVSGKPLSRLEGGYRLTLNGSFKKGGDEVRAGFGTIEGLSLHANNWLAQ